MPTGTGYDSPEAYCNGSMGVPGTDTPILGHPDLPVQPSLRLLGKAFPRVPVPTPAKRHARRRKSQTQAKKDAPMTEPTPIGTLEAFHANRIRLAQKSLSITYEATSRLTDKSNCSKR